VLGKDFQKQPPVRCLRSHSSDPQWCVEPLAGRRMELAAVLWGRTMVAFMTMAEEEMEGCGLAYSSGINSVR